MRSCAIHKDFEGLSCTCFSNRLNLYYIYISINIRLCSSSVVLVLLVVVLVLYPMAKLCYVLRLAAAFAQILILIFAHIYGYKI